MRQSSPKVVSAQARDEIVAQLAQALAERPEIVFAYVHGSFVESRPFRDIDVAVWVDPAAVGARHPVDYEIDLGLAVQQRVRMPGGRQAPE